jgi:hypothetical protein
MINANEIAIKWAKKRFLYLQQVDSDFKFKTQYIDFDDRTFWSGEVIFGLPEYSVVNISMIYFDMKGNGDLSDREIFKIISSSRNQQIQSHNTPNGIVDFVALQLEAEFETDPELDFRIGYNGFTRIHILDIITDVKKQINIDREQLNDTCYDPSRSSGDENVYKAADKATFKKEAKDYGKTWLGAIIMGAAVLLGFATGSFVVLIVLGLLAGIILSNTLFKDIQG